MIRAHLATFPARIGILFETLDSIHAQVDQVFVVFNEYAALPPQLERYDNIKAIIPDRDLKDTGKFFFPVDNDDIVFTIDDDIIYPPDYVTTTLAQAKKLDFDTTIVGYQAHKWVYRKQLSRLGWRNFMFHKRVKKPCHADILGTGTACMLGKNMPPFADFSGSAGFVDIRFGNMQKDAGRGMCALPRDDGYLRGNLPDHLFGSSLLHMVGKTGRPDLVEETYTLISKCDPLKK